MTVGNLPIPQALLDLIKAGRWPRNRQEANKQNLTPRIPKDLIRRIAPDEYEIILYPPPFGGPVEVFSKFADFRGQSDSESPPGDIDYYKAIVIGDFGLGSDAAIALDYRLNRDCPAVIRYRWSHIGGPDRWAHNRWVYVAQSFSEFAQMLGLCDK